MASSALFLLLVSLATYFGYYGFTISVRPWVYYPMLGLLAVAAGHPLRGMFALAFEAERRPWHRRGLLCGVAAGSLMISEGLQQFACGLIDAKTGGVDVCRSALGSDAMSALASILAAGLVVWKWPPLK
jgi:hypothetical protein